MNIPLFTIETVNAVTSIKDRLNKAGTNSFDTSATALKPVAIFGSVINVGLSILGVIFIFLIITAGYKWMMAQGDPKKVDAAKDTIWRAVIGLIIIVSAYAIKAFVFDKL